MWSEGENASALRQTAPLASVNEKLLNELDLSAHVTNQPINQSINQSIKHLLRHKAAYTNYNENIIQDPL